MEDQAPATMGHPTRIMRPSAGWKGALCCAFGRTTSSTGYSFPKDQGTCNTFNASPTWAGCVTRSRRLSTLGLNR
jgi:hypothetical protein